MVRRGRLSKGCEFCRRRKIKCDQLMPACTQCLKSGWKCPQYADSVERMFQYQHFNGRSEPIDKEFPQPSSISSDRATALAGIMHRPSSGSAYFLSQPPVLYLHSPSASIPCDAAERRYFETFRQELGIIFCGYFETPFWTHLVPRECHHEPAIRHAIFAFAALCKSSRCNLDAAVKIDEHLNFALVQYGKAVRVLRQNLADGATRVRLALITSVLLGWFESFYGNWNMAAQQLCGGLNIMRYMQGTKNIKSRKRRRAAEGLITIDPELNHALGCLEVQLISFLAMNPLYNDPFSDTEDQPIHDLSLIQDLPSRFVTLDEAFPSAISLTTRALLVLRRFNKRTNGEPVWFPGTLELNTLEMTLDRWNKAFSPILKEASQHVASRIHLKALELHIGVIAAELIVSSTIKREELMFDKATLQFQYIVSMSRRLLEKEHELRTSTEPKTQFSVGLITILYYSATRCRDPTVRRDAISVLREWPSRYGLWDSVQAAKVAEWVLGIEEEGCDNLKVIPEEKRIKMTTLNVKIHSTGGVSVQCKRGLVDHLLELGKGYLL